MSDDFGVHILLRLISRMPAQQVLVYLALADGLSPGQVLQRFGDMPLEEMLRQLEEEFSAKPCLGPDTLHYPGWFKTLHEQMESKGEEGTRRAAPRRRFVPFFPRSNGRIQLDEFLQNVANPDETLAKWAQEVETVVLIANLLAEIPGAMEHLIAHERWVEGYIAARVENRRESNQVLNRAWNRIYKKLHTFDPATTNFRTFAVIWVPYAIGSSVARASRLPVVTDATGDSPFEESRTEPAGDKVSIIEANLSNFHWSREVLADYLEQSLSEEQQIEIEEHLAGCELCANQVRRLHPPNYVWQKTATN